MDDVTAVTVDSYSTLVDVDSQATVLEEEVDGVDAAAADAISETWRTQYLVYSMLANDIDAYRPFRDLIDMGLAYALAVHGYEVDDETRDRIRREVYHERLDVFDDVRPGVERLVDAGYPVFVLSNGDPGMLDHLVEAAEIGDLVGGAISADEVETYKPNAAIYRHGAARVGAPIDEILHVSGGGMRDVWGAKHAGMKTAWLARPEKTLPRESLGPAPDAVVESLGEVADRLA
ncbi:MAG: haloacid dehalogenase type II [Haloferacaceae archaeon]